MPFGLDELAGVYVGGGRTTVTAERNDDRLVLDIGAAGATSKLRAELVVRDSEEPILECALPELSLAFFRETRDNAMGLMLALTAYKQT